MLHKYPSRLRLRRPWWERRAWQIAGHVAGAIAIIAAAYAFAVGMFAA